MSVYRLIGELDAAAVMAGGGQIGDLCRRASGELRRLAGISEKAQQVIDNLAPHEGEICPHCKAQAGYCIGSFTADSNSSGLDAEIIWCVACGHEWAA